MESDRVIKTYMELKLVCQDLGKPWSKKYLNSFFENIFWYIKGSKEHLIPAREALDRLGRLLKKEGYFVDELSIIDDIDKNYARSP